MIDFISDDYDHIHSVMRDYMKEWFGEDLLIYHSENCKNEDFLEESEDRDNPKIIKAIYFILSQIENKYVCKFWVDPEVDEDDVFWVMIFFNNKFNQLLGRDRILVRNHLYNQIEENIEKYLSIQVEIGTSVDDKCQ